jgi:hypothetical protein
VSSARLPGATVLGSINGFTGALVVGAGFVAFVLGAVSAEIAIGRPGSGLAFTIVLGIPIMGMRGSLVGALLGFVTHRFVRRTSFSGPVDRRMVVGGVILAVVVGAASGAYSVRRSEILNLPRVMQSDGRITRSVASSVSEASRPAVVLYNGNSRGAMALDWNSQRVGVAIEDQTLILSRNAAEVDRVNLEGLDYARQVVGTTAMLDRDNREWLAVVIRLRATGRRELLLIYDPSGVRTYQELLARDDAGLTVWSSGGSGGRQEFILKMGELLRYGR